MQNANYRVLKQIHNQTGPTLQAGPHLETYTEVYFVNRCSALHYQIVQKQMLRERFQCVKDHTVATVQHRGINVLYTEHVSAEANSTFVLIPTLYESASSEQRETRVRRSRSFSRNFSAVFETSLRPSCHTWMYAHTTDMYTQMFHPGLWDASLLLPYCRLPIQIAHNTRLLCSFWML